MYLFAKLGGRRLYGNEDTISYINLYTLEKAELTTAIHYNERFSKSGTLVYNSKVLGMVGRKARRRTQAIEMRYVFVTNAVRLFYPI